MFPLKYLVPSLKKGVKASFGSNSKALGIGEVAVKNETASQWEGRELGHRSQNLPAVESQFLGRI